ncbi:alpha/beta hydrolase [Mycobacterium sp. M26]|uniref:alpha/beta fold hydrolase n=1 Tax=Mycobacterium sp. M26 TaxID=1762962 RepID=UPI00073EF4C7|nr:alpha/beta hydrolase [Mycobacterium sp. M26]
MRVPTNGITLDVIVEGEGPDVLLLHGWPDDRTVWREQIPALVSASYRVIAPDLRGCGESDRPTEVSAYRTPTLLADVIGLLDALEISRTHLIGHDWGAGLSWALGALLPDRIDHLACLSVGHPGAFHRTDYDQIALSWYMLMFQFEGVAEEWLSANDYQNFRAWTRHPEPDVAVERLSRPGHLTAGLNWYRANLGPTRLITPPMELPPITSPTLGVWSSDDFAVLEPQMTQSAEYVSGPWRYERLEGVGHWIPLEAAQRCSELLLDFLPS